MRYKGGVISATPPTTSLTSAPGIWTLEQQMQAKATSSWPGPPVLVNYLVIAGGGSGGSTFGGGGGAGGVKSMKYEPVKYAKGGKVSSASKRADGCAIRGKTKGKMV